MESIMFLKFIQCSFFLFVISIFVPSAYSAAPEQASSLDVESTKQQQIVVDSNVLAEYVGYYKLGSVMIIKVTNDGQRLFAQLTGQPIAEIFPSSEAEFFYKIADAQISFVKDGQSKTSALILHQNGQHLRASRVDNVVANEIQTSTAVKIKDQQPTPGSETALHRMIDGLNVVPANLDEMSSELAQATQQQLPDIQAHLKKLGALKSAEFVGVTDQGADNYLLRHEHGTEHVVLVLDSKGIITAAFIGL